MSENGCGDNEEVIFLLKNFFASNESNERYLSAVNLDKKGSCENGYREASNTSGDQSYTGPFLIDLIDMADDIPSMIPTFGRDLYAYTTPFIICLGLLGNTASLFVFLSQRLRKLSASLYLAALSASDTIVLISYVFLTWLTKGLQHWPGNHRLPIIHHNGTCHAFLFISYTFRFISVYLIVVFTIERYIAVCKPLHRRMICTKNFARKLIVLVHVMGAIISVYKPVLSGVYNVSHIIQTTEQPALEETASESPVEQPHDPVSTQMCMRNPDYDDVLFVMELVYGLLITAVPFTLMTFFNLMIIRKLINRFRDKTRLQMSFRDNKIRWEFTMMLLVVSSSFILLNLPYFVIWVQQFRNTINTDDPLWVHKLSNQLLITRTIFNINYCLNFVVYCLTGSYYRGVIKDWFSCRHTTQPNGYISVRKPSNSISMTTQGTCV